MSNILQDGIKNLLFRIIFLFIIFLDNKTPMIIKVSTVFLGHFIIIFYAFTLDMTDIFQQKKKLGEMQENVFHQDTSKNFFFSDGM